jgi:hypothetical protein
MLLVNRSIYLFIDIFRFEIDQSMVRLNNIFSFAAIGTRLIHVDNRASAQYISTDIAARTYVPKGNSPILSNCRNCI